MSGEDTLQGCERQEEDGNEGEKLDVVALLDSSFGCHDAFARFLDGSACIFVSIDRRLSVIRDVPVNSSSLS